MAFGKKKKEKPLTLAEALELIKPDLVPLWHGSKPLLVAFSAKEGETATLFPLDKTFAEKTWLLVFVDPTGFSRDTVLNFIKTLYDRYAPLGLSVILVLRATFTYFFSESAVQGFIGRRKIPFPVVVDKDQKIAEALGIVSPPGYAIIPEEPQIEILKAYGNSYVQKIESDIRKMLWEFDPGLPLLAPFDLPESHTVDVEGIDFTKTEQHLRFDFKKTGRWETRGDKIFTDDPEATLKFKFRGSELALIAESGEERFAQTRILFRVSSDEDPGANHELALDQPKNYGIVSGNFSKNKEVTLSFPNAGRIPVALYGARIGKSTEQPTVDRTVPGQEQ